MQRSAGPLRLFVTVVVAMLAGLLVPPASKHTPDGRLFTHLSAYRSVTDPDPSILIIERPAEVSSGVPVRQGNLNLSGEFFLILAEMGAKEALLTLPGDLPTAVTETPPREPSGAATEISRAEDEQISERITKEFDGIKKNVETLFNGIRFGSVKPQEAADFVDNLLLLIDESGERLLDDILHAEARGALLLEKARRVFGEENLGNTPSDLGYVFPDYEGAFAVTDYPSVTDNELPFRRLSIEPIYRYIGLEQELALLVDGMEDAGYFTGVQPEMQPAILADQVEALRNELLDAPGPAAKRSWLDAKETYVQSLHNVLNGDVEAGLDEGFARLLQENEDDEADRIDDLRERLAGTFRELRQTFTEYSALRSELAEKLAGACCIVGTAPDPYRENAAVWSQPTAAETAAARIRSIRLERFNVVLTDFKEKAFLAVPGVLFAVLLSLLSPALTLLVGFLLVIATLAGYGFLFVTTGIFVHPGYAAVVPAAAMVASFTVYFLSRERFVRPVPALVDHPSAPGGGEDLSLSFPVERDAVILAVRWSLDDAGSTESRLAGRTEALQGFHNKVESEATACGGLIVGTEGPVILVGFGISFEDTSDAISGGGTNIVDHVETALSFASRLSEGAAGRAAGSTFGLDVGECGFYASADGGYSVEGRPAVYARALSRLAVKHRHMILVTEDVVQSTGDKWQLQKLNALAEKGSGRKRVFYALIGRRSV